MSAAKFLICCNPTTTWTEKWPIEKVGCGYFFIELIQNGHFYVIIMYGDESPLRHVGIQLCSNFTLESFLITLMIQ